MDKSRGKKHREDKTKYKPKPPKKTNPQGERKIPRPVLEPAGLESNWDRYSSEEEDIHVHKLDSRTDFSILANAKITQGSHFQFKSDIHDSTSNEAQLPKNIFNLDLNLLGLSIATIPFYEGLDPDLFTDYEKTYLKKEADVNKVAYEQYVSKHYSNEIKIVENKVTETLCNLVLNPSESVEDEIQEHVPSIEKNIHEAHENVQKKDENDLETWLDDILGD